MAPNKPGSSAGTRGQEDQQRNVLFDGAARASNGGPSEGGEAGTSEQAAPPELTVQQLVGQVVKTHKDTTQITNRALKLVEETKQIQSSTLKALEHQGEQMDNIDRNLQVMNVELSYSEKLLLYMRRCCCCAMFDSCTGADPEKKLKGDWRKRAATGTTDAHAAQLSNQDAFTKLTATAAAARGKAPVKMTTEGGTEVPPGPKHRDPNINLQEGMESTEMMLHEQTRVQNQNLDAILAGLDDIKQGAMDMTTELKKQNHQIEYVENGAEGTAGRMLEINTKSQLGHYRAKNSSQGNSSSSSALKTAMLTHALKL